MNALAIFVTIGVLFIPILGDRPARRPGNLTPVQLISALGAWTLVFANASAAAIGIRDDAIVLLATAVAALLTALALMLRPYATNVSAGETPPSLQAVVDELKELLGGAPRLGVATLDVAVVEGRGPGISVVVMRRGRVVVRVRRDVASWLESHRRQGGAGGEVVASFARFIILHELAHVLNGDHRTFRFVRSVLLSQLVWVAGTAAAAASLVLGGDASARPLIVSMSVVLLAIVQTLVARRFIAERERLADWRALQTLPPQDAARLLERRGRRRAVANPTTLEKLMIDLKVRAASDQGGVLSRLIGLVWAEGDEIRRRTEKVGGDRAGDAARPVLWAALSGMQCGLLSMNVAVALILAVTPWMPLRLDASLTLVLAVTTWIAAPVVTYCALRVDPARASVRRPRVIGRRVVAGVVFYLAFAASALAASRFHARFAVVAMPPPPLLAVILVAVGMVVMVSVWISTMFGSHEGGGGELVIAPRASWATVFPLLGGLAFVLVPLSVIVSARLGIGSFRSAAWVPLAFLSFAAFVASTVLARSTSAILRRIAPMALLDTPEPVYGFRILWRDFYIDLTQVTLARAAAVAVSVQLVALPFFVAGAASLVWTLSRVLTAQATFITTFFTGVAVMSFILTVPDRYRAYAGPSARLLDTSRLQLFERLLAAARIADPVAAESLRASLAQWIRDDRFPDALLPDPTAVWPLSPLRILVQLARDVGEEAVLERWRGRIEESLRTIVTNGAVAVAPRQPPSMHWTVVAATVVDEAGLHDKFGFERMLERVEELLADRLEHGTANLLADVVAAWQLLRRHGRSVPDPDRVRELAGRSTLVNRPALRQSLAELAEVAELMRDAALRERLGSIIRSRSWEGLQLNPRKDVLLLLDCYLAASRLGELDGRHSAAGLLIGEIAGEVSRELATVVRDASVRSAVPSVL